VLRSPGRLLRWFRLLAGALWVLACAAQTDPVDLGRPAQRLFTDKDGLPQNSIEGIVVDPKGYLWVATQDGPARYNGRTWEAVRPEGAGDSLWVRAAERFSDGSLWFGRTVGGALQYKDGRWTVHRIHPSVDHRRVSALCELAEGRVLAGTDNGLWIWDGSLWAPWRVPDDRNLAPITCLHREPGTDVLWIGTERGLARLEGGAWTWFSTPEGLPSAEVWTLETLPAAEGGHEVWVGTDGGLARLQGRRFVPVGPREGLPLNAVNALVPGDPSGQGPRLWVGMDSGLAYLEQGRWHLMGLEGGLPTATVRSLWVQSGPGTQTILWVGTYGGLVRYPRSGWTTLDARVGVPENLVFTLVESRDGKTYYAGTLGGGLARFRGGRWETLGAREGIPDRQILSLLETGTPDRPVLWVGSRTGGVLRHEGGRTRRYGLKDGLPDAWIYSLEEIRTPEGHREVWVGTRQGPARLEGEHWRYPEGTGNLPKAIVSMIRQVRDGRVFVGTRGQGVQIFDGRSWTQSAGPDGLGDNRIWCLLEQEDPQGRPWIWAGTYHGLFRAPLDRSPLAWEPVAEVRSDIIYSLQSDRMGRTYVFTQRGVLRLTPQPDASGFTLRHFTTGDGLPSNGCTQGSSMVDRQGRIWTGTVAGAAVYDPRQEEADRTLKPLHFEWIRSGSRALGEDEPIEIGWREARLSLSYALLSYFREEDNRYRTQMEGLEDQPGPWTEEGKREFPSLPPGTYTFRVWARDAAGNEAVPLALPITVLPPPWATWWARLLMGLGLAGLVALAIGIRLRSLRRRNEALEIKVQERTRDLAEAMGELEIAREEAMKANQAKGLFLATLSHEIRTPLNGIIGMSGMLIEASTTPSQKEFAETIHGSGEGLLAILNEVLDFSRVESGRMELESIPFDPVGELEEALGLFAEAAQRKGLELVGQFAPDMPHQIVGDPARLRQVAVNLLGNALKFTLEGEVVLRAGAVPRSEGGWTFHLEVCDTGIGIAPEAQEHLFDPFTQAERSTTRRFGGSGLGLAICHRILACMGGSIEVESEIGKGTCFHCIAPFGSAPEAGVWEPLPSGTHVLVCEQHPASRAALEATLQAWDLEFTALPTLEAALERSGPLAGQASVLLLGRPIRETDPVPSLTRAEALGLPVVLLVGVGALSAAEGARAAGRCAYVSKPCRRSRLRHTLRQMLGLEEGRAQGQRGKVLVVDDNPTNRRVADLHLRSLGYEVVCVPDGPSALDRLESGGFDAVLMDCEMPGMDGFEVTRRLREREGRSGHTIVLAVTAHSVERARSRAQACGMDGFLTKPLRREPLLAALSRWIASPMAGSVVAELDPDTWSGLEHLEALSGPGAIAELVQDFRKDVPKRLAHIAEAFQRQAPEDVARWAHDLKSNAATLGLRVLAEAAARLEDRAREGYLDAEALQQYESQLPAALEALEQRVGPG